MSKGRAGSEAKVVAVGLGVKGGQRKEKKKGEESRASASASAASAGARVASNNGLVHSRLYCTARLPFRLRSHPGVWLRLRLRLRLPVPLPIPAPIPSSAVVPGAVWCGLGWCFDKRYRLSGAGSGSRSTTDELTTLCFSCSSPASNRQLCGCISAVSACPMMLF